MSTPTSPSVTFLESDSETWLANNPQAYDQPQFRANPPVLTLHQKSLLEKWGPVLEKRTDGKVTAMLIESQEKTHSWT